MKKPWIEAGKFVMLSAKQASALETDDQILAYADAKAEHYNEINEGLNQKLETLETEKASKEDIDAVKEEIKAQTTEQLKALTKLLKSHSSLLTKLRNGAGLEADPSGLKSLGEQLREKQAVLREARDTKTPGMQTFEIKAPANMTFPTHVTGQVPVEEREQGLNRIRRRRPWVMQEISTGPTMSNLLSWVEQVNPDGGAGGTAEGTLKNKADFDLIVASVSIKKRSVFIKVSDEMIDDIEWLESEINTELFELLMLDVDNQLLNGDNIGLNLNGIIPQSVAWTPGSLASSVDQANNWDVLKRGITQVLVAHHEPTVIFMHPEDVLAMQLTKGSDGHYVLPPFTSADGLQVDALPVKENTGIAVDDFLIMDAPKCKAAIRKAISIQTGWENDDFTRNFMTILAEIRLNARIKGNDVTAFVTGDFTSAKAALETV